jgi:hypothetical protein
MTIRDYALEWLFSAEKAGRITGAERREVTRMWDERDCYAQNAMMKARPNFMEREAACDEIMNRALA